MWCSRILTCTALYLAGTDPSKDYLGLRRPDPNSEPIPEWSISRLYFSACLTLELFVSLSLILQRPTFISPSRNPGFDNFFRNAQSCPATFNSPHRTHNIFPDNPLVLSSPRSCVSFPNPTNTDARIRFTWFPNALEQSLGDDTYKSDLRFSLASESPSVSRREARGGRSGCDGLDSD